MADNITAWLGSLRGKFVVFEGIDGSGKSTQMQRFVSEVHASGVVVCQVREPGGTPIGEQIRRVLLDPANDEMDVRCEMLLYMASRAQLVVQQIKPALERGELVLADRFISSTLAYQGTAGGLSEADIHTVGEFAVRSCYPDLTVVLDIDEITAAKRLVGSSKHKAHVQINQPSLFSDRMELNDTGYWRKVRQGYLDQADQDPGRYLVVDASGDEDSVFTALMDGVKAKFEATSSG